MQLSKKKFQNLFLSLLIPCAACAVQWFFWDKFQPFIWFLFYPSIFFSARVGGRQGGIAATILSVVLSISFFAEPIYSFKVYNTNVLYSAMIFILMGVLFSNLQERLKLEQYNLQVSEAALRKLNEGLEERVNERALELQTTEKRYRLISENSADVIWVMDPTDGTFTYVSPSVKKLRGYTPEEVMAQPVSESLTPESLELVNELMAIHSPAFIANGNGTESFITEVNQPRKDGSIVNTEVTTTYLFNEQGKVEIIGVSRDITERKRVEEKLREADARFSKVFHASPVGINIFKLADNCSIDANNTFLDIIGYSRTEVIGHSAGELNLFVNPETRQAWTKSLLDGSAIRNQDTIIRRKNGELRNVLASIDVIDINGEAMGLVITTDITDREQAEQALKDSQARLEGIINSAMDAIVSLDSDQKIMLFNPAAKVMFGFDQVEVLGQSIESFMPERFRASHPKHIQNFAQTGVTNRAMGKLGTVQGLRKNGEEFPLEASISQTDVSGKIIFTVILRDITERTRMERNLHESQELFTKAFRANPAAMIITRLADGQIIDLNASYERILGYKRTELIGKSGIQLNILVKPQEREEIIAQVREHGHVYDYETHLLANSGEIKNVLFSIELIELGGEKCMLSIMYDITERIQAEEELKRSNAELEQFAYVASHDLQEPLRAVAGMVQLLGQRYKGRLDENADEYIGHAVEASTRMQKLINDLLDYSRVDRFGKPFEPTNIERVLKTTLSNLQISIEENNVQITHDPLPTVMADPGQISQVLQNLISNAIKFRGERPPQIHISAEKVDNAWCFSVHDNGIGIDPQYFERIFLVFQRLHTRREYPGTGIGLSLCKRIVERHNGRIWVESQSGQGATFYFTIPEKTS